uniref:Uncharacterized protein n=1 Tax=Arcella intermedia TaxID=1963864 RepID=A0A6B2LLX2_9EUKA
MVSLGSTGVGKTTFVHRFLENTFIEDTDPTIDDAYMKEITMENTTVKVHIMDTTGDNEYYALRDQWIRTGEFFIFFFSLTDHASFEHLDATVKQVMRLKDLEGWCPMIMVGCKSDLETERQVTPEMIQLKSMEYNFAYIETSSKTGTNIQAAIEMAINNTKRTIRK